MLHIRGAALRSNEPGPLQAGFASIPSLVAMKRAAGRSQDLVDIEKLEKIAELRRHDTGA